MMKDGESVMEQQNDYILRLEGICKSFEGVDALVDVTIGVQRGEIHGIVGENGAGKSTLMKILSGALAKDRGEIYLNEECVHIHNPHDAQQLGISIIYQERNLIPEMTVAENIYLHDFPKTSGFLIDTKTLNANAQKLTKSLGHILDPSSKTGDLSVAYQQIVEIAKALSFKANIIIFDEPTTPLTRNEITLLFETIRSLQKKGVTIIYISHVLEDILSLCNRVTVLKDGRFIQTVPVRQTTQDELINLMLGRSLKEKFPTREKHIGRKFFSIMEKQDRKQVLHVNQGEIVGIFGIVGSGRSELMLNIFGASPDGKFFVEIDGKHIENTTPLEAIRHGIGFATEDRKNLGLLLDMSIDENIIISLIAKNANIGYLKQWKYAKISEKFADFLKIKMVNLRQFVKNLSGGNQQKVILSRWLATACQVIIFDEPTKGIDVGAKIEIYKLMHDLVNKGNGIIMLSSEVEEIIGMSDRVYIMKNGSIVKELLDNQITDENILTYAMKGA